jgi:Ribbon-helix-helix domain
MSRKKVSTTIYITPEQADRLKLLHERTKVPVSVYIREGIDMMLKHYEHVLPGQMSLDAAPVPSLASIPSSPSAPPPARREPLARAVPKPLRPADDADEPYEGDLEGEPPKPVAKPPAPPEEDAPRTLAGAQATSKPPSPSRSGGQRAGAHRQPGSPRSSGDGS